MKVYLHSHTIFVLILILINQTRETSGDKMGNLKQKLDEIQIEKADYEDLVSIAKGVVGDLESAHDKYFYMKNMDLRSEAHLSQAGFVNSCKEDLLNALELNSQVQFHIQSLLTETNQKIESIKKELKPAVIDL